MQVVSCNLSKMYIIDEIWCFIYVTLSLEMSRETGLKVTRESMESTGVLSAPYVQYNDMLEAKYLNAYRETLPRYVVSHRNS